MLAIAAFLMSGFGAAYAIYQFTRYSGKTVVATASEAVSLLNGNEDQQLHVSLTDLEFDCRKAAPDSDKTTWYLPMSDRAGGIAIIGTFDRPPSCQETARDRQIIGFLSIEKQKDLESLKTIGIDLSWRNGAERVYCLCTACGTRDGILGCFVFVVAGFLALLMVKAEKRRKLAVATGELVKSGPSEVRDLGLLLILLGGAAVYVGSHVYILEFIPLWTAGVIFLPLGTLCLFGSRSKWLLRVIDKFNKVAEEAGLIRQAGIQQKTCAHCGAVNPRGATSCAECGSILE